MNGKLGQSPIERVSAEPAWVTWWRTHTAADAVVHVETKGQRKRARRERRGKR